MSMQMSRRLPDIKSAFAGVGRPLIVAHRGVWRSAPENSRAAIRAAQPFDMVEIDVRLSADGMPVLIHDDTLDRTTDRSGAVATLTAAQLQHTRLRGSTETVPHLVDALDAGGPALLFDIDVKDPAQLDTVAGHLSTHPAKDRVMLKADVAHRADLDALLKLQAKYELTVIAKSVLAQHGSLDLLVALRDAGVSAVELWFHDLGQLRAAARIGLPLTTYTLDDVHCAGLSDTRARRAPDEVWGVLAQAGIRAIMTDAPEAALDYFSGRSTVTRVS